jgi:hypothetical protein
MSWNEFFRRFTPTIKAGIHSILDKVPRPKTLYVSKDGILSREDEASDAVYIEVVAKLYSGDLNKLIHYSDVSSWLFTVAQNEARDWLSEQNTIKNGPKLEGEHNSFSIDEPLDDSEELLEGVLKQSKSNSNDDAHDEVMHAAKKSSLRHVMAKIDSAPKDKSYWVHRLSIVKESDLDKKEIIVLSELANRTVKETETKLKAVMEYVYKKNARCEKSIERASELTSELRKIEKKLYRSNEFLSQDESKDLKNRLIQKTGIRDKHIKKSQIQCRPSNKHIADLINLTGKEAKQVSSLLLRYTEKLGQTPSIRAKRSNLKAAKVK